MDGIEFDLDRSSASRRTASLDSRPCAGWRRARSLLFSGMRSPRSSAASADKKNPNPKKRKSLLCCSLGELPVTKRVPKNRARVIRR